jgi:hypothetical protein
MTPAEQFEKVWANVNVAGNWSEFDKQMAKIVYLQGIVDGMDECFTISQKVADRLGNANDEYTEGYNDGCFSVGHEILKNIKESE